MVQSAGNYQFLVSKQIEFNGETFRTWSPSAFLTINQRNLNAATPVSNIPLLGPLASNVALGVAEQRRPLTDLVTAQRITQTVAPEFNSRLDAELSRLNDRLANSVRPLLASKQLTPSNVATSSTDDALLLAVSFDPETAPAAARGRVYPLSSSADPGKSKDRFQVPMQLLSSTPGDGFVPRSGPSGSGTPPTASVARDASQLLIHESLVASLAARFGLAGKEVPDGALQKLLLPGASTESGPPTAQMGTILLSPDRPLSATFANGEIILEVRVGFRPVVGPELPQQTIAVAIVPKLTDASIEFTPTLRSITPVNPGPEGALGPMAEGIIRQAIEQRMKTASVPRSFTAPRDGDQPGIPLRVAQLTVTEGWIRAALEVAPAGSVPSGSEQTWQTPAPRAASIPAK
jgi:hypothetical protein